MKRLFLLIGVLLALSAPVLAQSATPDPASFIPTDASVYIELRTDSAGLNALTQVLNLTNQLVDNGQTDTTDSAFTRQLASALLGIDFSTDIQPWIGDRIGFAQITTADSSLVIVLPIRDANGAQAFVAKATAGATPQLIAGVNLYTTSTAGLLVASNVIWLSDPTTISNFVKTPMFQHLSDDPAYQQVRAALPADAIATAYLRSSVIASALAQTQGSQTSTQVLNAYLQAALRLHPAQSVAEDALLKSPALNGVGIALQSSGSSLNVTAALSIAAQYPEPTLTTATAGTALLPLIPGNSFFVFDSYDISTLVAPSVPIFSTLRAVNTQGIYDSIQSELQGTPTAVPSPTASPTPITADALVAQIQPLINQAASLSGLSLDQLYSLIDGEYALAVFPGAGPTIGAALYLQSSNPQQIIDALDHASKLILVNLINGQQLITVDHGTVSGTAVTFIRVPNIASRFALGIIDKNVLFVTQESTLQQVLAAAKKQTPTTPAIQWRDTLGKGQEALFYVEPRTIDLYNLREQRTPPLPITTIAGTLDVQGNGLFLLHLMVTTGA